MKSKRYKFTYKPESIVTYLKNIWSNRAFAYTFAKRDIRIKYAQTFLGLAWTIIQPLTAVVVYTVFFTLLVDFKMTYPYILFVLSGITLWGLFNYIFSQGSTSLLSNYDLIKKLHFPKILLPISKVIVALVEFVIIFILFVMVFIYYKSPLSLKVFWVFPIIFALIIFALGLSFLLSALTLKNRDLNHIIPFLINFGIWFTPVFYPTSLIPEKFAKLLYVNPMASYLHLFRWSVLNEPFNSYSFFGVFIGFIIFILGFYIFKLNEDIIADVV